MIAEIVLGVLTVLGLTTLCLLFKFNSSKNYWPRRGIKVATFPSMFPMGNSVSTCFSALFSRANKWDLAQEQVRDLRNEKCYGVYGIGWKPVLILNDPEMVRQFLVKDFNYFVDRKFPFEKFLMKETIGDKLWLKMVLFAGGDEWKDMRSTFSPIFSSGKMKQMAHLMNEITHRLVDSLEDDIKHGGGVIDLMDKFDRFSLDNIASCAFGIDAQAFTDKDSKFVQNARAITNRGFKDALKILTVLLPGGRQILNGLGTSVMKSKETMFFFDLVKAAIDMRKQTKEKRNDLIDLMIDAMKDELNDDDDKDEEQYDQDAKLTHRRICKEFDIITLGATAFVMLVAGYDTTSQTLSYVGYMLATHPEIQEKLREEVDKAYDENGGMMPTYYAIQEMEYLDMVIHETLRCTSPVPFLSRVCTKDYTVPGYPQVTIRANDEVYVNAAGIHMNPQYYPDPDKFIPERFSKEQRAKRHPYTFLGFGQGPRSCIGMRFALYEAKVGTVTMLRKYKLVKTSKTPEKIRFDPKSVLTASLDPLWVKVEGI